MPNPSVAVMAPAKVNLSLHVTGQRADGYHLLDSLVVFASVGDTLNLRRSDALTLSIEGPEAAALTECQDNLVLKVARLFEDLPGVAIRLNKQLPVSSGIGGGSADAAAAFRGLVCMQNDLSPADEIPFDLFEANSSSKVHQLAALGADIPVCLQSHTMRMRGIGDDLTPVQGLPAMWAVLVNPRVAVPTPAVFKELATKSNSPMPDEIPRFEGVHQFVAWLAMQRNDLEPPALLLAPEIGQVLKSLNSNAACLLARMSGSGATCFGLYANKEGADAAAKCISVAQPNWWVRSALLDSQVTSAMPRIS